MLTFFFIKDNLQEDGCCEMFRASQKDGNGIMEDGKVYTVLSLKC